MKKSDPITADTQNNKEVIEATSDLSGSTGTSGTSGAKGIHGKWCDKFYRKYKR